MDLNINLMALKKTKGEEFAEKVFHLIAEMGKEPNLLLMSKLAVDIGKFIATEFDGSFYKGFEEGKKEGVKKWHKSLPQN